MATQRAITHDQLTGRQKVAIVCMAMGAEAASQITQRLTADDVEMITLEIAQLERISLTVVEQVLSEMLEDVTAAESLTSGGIDYAREMLEKSFGQTKAAATLKRIQSQIADTNGLQRLRNADPQQLGNMLRGEHPQTIALILAHLNAHQTAAILKEIEPAIGSEVVYRMARMERVSPDMLQLIERSLSSETDLQISHGMSSSGGPAAVAAVLNLIAPSMEKEIMDGIAAQDPALCEQIKNLMFVFEDIVKLDDRSVQRLLREVDSKELALALKTASPKLRDRILNAMTQRAASALKEEMEFLGPVRLRDVETAQSAVVAQVRALEESGEIVLSAGRDDQFIE